ncbi:MAG: acetylglutamate kinase [Veillonella sp.]|uniref:acetylglutamate kinase n=1 Tax=Veillonella sp. TaxID=1926307 RepID=UPI001B48C672|nr:acetylglutamate kinase [Veillonella sp.]NCB95990.1 acetylglutamate kinase [Negativicutes bacterium]MBP6923058.1 acetylglutamate kinase [Veillonella sp.]MBP8616139.1 acetylglutamate kinase [Veillonella sp.]MBP9516572.1 acetylglutamate kinase [Veillonella sp.]MBP9551330.1 acetylglutamate kinase [Veillonella sp.]
MDKVTNAKRAQILTAAVPYIKEYTDKYVVVKYGGNAMTDPELKKSVMQDLLLLNLVGVKVVLVHGGGPEINSALDKMQIESTFKDGLRVTDEPTMEVVQMVLAGKVNKGLVANIVELGGKAVGLCGIDGNMIKVHKKNADLGLVGEIDDIDTTLIETVISQGYIPVLSSIGVDENGVAYNINADTVAAKVAGALQAETMVAMTNIDGVMRDKDNPTSLIPQLSVAEAEQLKQEGIIAGGMIPKVDCCLEAIEAGAQKVFIINGEIPHAILIELLTNEGLGTMFVK